MPLRQRLSLVAAVAVAVAIALVAMVCYLVVRGQLLNQVDDALTNQAAEVQHVGLRALASGPPSISASAGGPAPYWEIVDVNGNVAYGNVNLPVGNQVESVAAGNQDAFMATVNAGASNLRVLAVPIGATGYALMLARPLSGVDHVLGTLRVILLLLCLGGVALAAALGRMASRRVLAPLAEVAQTAEHISETEDLSSRIRVHADDEVGALAQRFNAMIERLQTSREALDESVRAQRQLVADASHELRTPVTSLRTNVEVLLAGGQLDEADRDRLLSDVVEQSEELSALVGDLIELARGDLPLDASDEVRLDRIVEESVARARRNAPRIRFEARLSPVVVDGMPERLARAVNNLLDNAARHSPDGGLVEVVVDDTGLCVRDHGAGFDDADLPFVFDRFFRGVNSRGRQGSGLGLAIVRQVAQQHGGSVSAEHAPGGGALLRIRLPTVPSGLGPAGGAALTPAGSRAAAPDER